VTCSASSRSGGCRPRSGRRRRCSPATRCGHAYFGTPHCLFATDAPFDSEQGKRLIASTIAAVEALEIGTADREQIFSGNARKLLKLQ